ncbi:MAG: hypothetical protein E6I78_02150, partial [Chloroflexi bacterium]
MGARRIRQMNGHIAAHARRVARSSSSRLAVALTTGLIFASLAIAQASATAPALSKPSYATLTSLQNAISPAGSARPAVLHPSKQARPQGHTVYPFRSIDPGALRLAKEKAARTPHSQQPSIGLTAPK